MRVHNLKIKKWGFSFLAISLLIAFLVFQVKAATDSSDAIAVRIMPNPNHYSIESWYKQQGYQGAPQKLLVDGYEAIRDGRTVFVNAANIDNNKIYTNIYLISYNQESNIKTVDILGQLVSHWKFNSNITDTGSCSVSTITCNTDKDCPDSYICSTGQVSAGSNITTTNKGKCVLKAELKCLSDSECPANIFCSSAKAKIIRDVKRLGQLNDIKDALKEANNRDAHYPDLSGGTYIPGNSISTWPSWKETLWPKLLGLGLIVDPINILGDCPGFEASTCWNKDRGSNDNVSNFYRTDSNGKPILPNGSYAYLYTSEKKGINYNLCVTFETKGIYDTAEGQISSQACLNLSGYSGVSANTAPEIKSSFLEGNSNLEFNGYVKALDRENDSISWRLETGSTNFSSWSAAPILRDAGDINQKKIYAAKTGNIGNYPVTLVLKDSRGAEARFPLILKVVANKPIIEAEDVEYFVNPVTPLNYIYYIQSNNGIGSYSMTLKSGSPDIFSGVAGVKTDLGTTRIKIDKSVLITPGTNLVTDRKLIYQISAYDNRGIQATKDVTIILKAEAPYLNFDCDSNARVNKAYPLSGSPCLIGNTKNANHSVSYSMSSFNGLRLSVNGDGNVYLSGTPSTFSPMGSPITITATNEYGAVSSKTFNLRVNNYCGDGVKQTPNSEGRGGSHNDGLEDCDGVDGTTKSVSGSSIFLQYGCSTTQAGAIYPILDGNSCIFAAGDKGGGYCGDNLCQFTIDGLNLENPCNCPMDCGRADNGTNCGTIVTPPVTTGKCGDGVIDVGEECDGTNLNNKTCQDFDSDYGIYGLSCNSSCKIVTSGCYAKSCWRDGDCKSNLCITQGSNTATYYCTSISYSHRCFTGTTKTTCESLKAANYDSSNIPQNYCDWVVQNGRCAINNSCIVANCNDNNACTDDSCSANGQCVHANNSGSVSCSVNYGTCNVAGTQSCGGSSGDCTGAINPTIANCSGKTCGADNGCGGKCIVNNFGTATCKAYGYYEDGSLLCSSSGSMSFANCLSGKCGDGNCNLKYETNLNCPGDCPTNVCVPACISKNCGDSDGCGGFCDAQSFGGKTCNTEGFYSGTLTCSGGKISTSGCSGKCGDGICDPYKENANNCPNDCKTCGNGTIDTGEECDGTNLNGKNCSDVNANYSAYGLSCDSSCKFVSTSCSSKSCWRNSDCASNSCVTSGTTASYYCTSTQYSHRCFSYYNKSTCEAAKAANNNTAYCEWVVQSGHCNATSVPVTTVICGDTVCSGSETSYSCPMDCGAPISS